MNVSVLAGMVSTGLFAVSYLPMLLKALRTKDLDSYSQGYLTLSNVANAVHSVHVLSLPLGPIRLLHSFYFVASALLLIWYLRFPTPPAITEVTPLGHPAHPQAQRS